MEYLTSYEGSFKLAGRQIDGATKLNGTSKPQFYNLPIEIFREKFTRNYVGNEYFKNPAICKVLNVINSKASNYENNLYIKIGLTKDDFERYSFFNLIMF